MKKSDKEEKLMISFGTFKIENYNPKKYSIVILLIVVVFILLLVKLD
jgi:hypothetical protein